MSKPTPPKAVTPPAAEPVVGTPMQEPAANSDATDVDADASSSAVKPPAPVKVSKSKDDKGAKYVNPASGLVDIKGAKFLPNTPRALTEEEAGNENITKRIDHAVLTGLLQKA